MTRTFNQGRNRQNMDIRESRALFTGGAESVLKGGPKTARDVIERFIAANKAKFNTDKEMLKNTV